MTKGRPPAESGQVAPPKVPPSEALMRAPAEVPDKGRRGEGEAPPPPALAAVSRSQASPPPRTGPSCSGVGRCAPTTAASADETPEFRVPCAPCLQGVVGDAEGVDEAAATGGEGRRRPHYRRRRDLRGDDGGSRNTLSMMELFTLTSSLYIKRVSMIQSLFRS